MDEQHTRLIFGLIFLILAVNTSMILGIHSLVTVPVSLKDSTPNTTIPMVLPAPAADTAPQEPAPQSEPVLEAPSPTPEPAPPTDTPVPDATDPIPEVIPDPPAQVNPFAYVTIHYPEPTVPPRHGFSAENVDQGMNNYVTIYSLKDVNATQLLPNVSFDLYNPPLIIEYDLTPFNITDIKHIEYKMMSTYYSEDISVNRPYEAAWFKVTVRDRNTGNVVLEDGYGREYGLICPRTISLQEAGQYDFEFDGNFVKINSLDMRVKIQDNIR